LDALVLRRARLHRRRTSPPDNAGLDSVTLEVVPADGKDARDQFLRLPWRLYAGMSNWVPNPLLLQRDAIDQGKNPFFEHGTAQLFLALRDGRPAGRISAQVDQRHVDYYKEQTGFFGFFECEDDPEACRALFRAAEGWLREQHMQRVRGPLSFSMDEECGVMIEGFEQPAMITMPQSLPYYPRLLEGQGFDKAMDLLAYRWEVKEPPARTREAIERTRAVPGLKLRRINMLRLQREVDIMLDIYQEAWSGNWGYVPVSRRAATKLASDLRLIADPRIVIMAEKDGEPAGFVAALPNLYEATRDFQGFLNPVNMVKLLWRLKVRGVESGRIFIFGVKSRFRTRELVGLPFLLLDELYRSALTRRYKWCEESWVLENNGPLNAMMPHWDARVYKRFRIYEKTLV
jgi:hypothetical protein